MITPMLKSNLVDIGLADVEIFSNAGRQRSNNLLTAYYEDSSNCSIVAINSEKKLVGYLFSHVWSDLAWIGPFGILPSYQGSGLGSKMINQVLSNLLEQDKTNIALETMPDSVRNIAFYSRNGFHSYGMRYRMVKPVPKKDEGLNQDYGNYIFREVSGDTSAIRKLSNMAYPGLDCSQISTLTSRYKLGKTALIYYKDQIVGFIILQLVDKRGNEGNSYLRVLVLMKEHEKKGLSVAIKWCEDHSIGNLTIPIYHIYWDIFQQLLDLGYSLASTGIRMIYNQDVHSGFAYDKRLILLCEWSG